MKKLNVLFTALLCASVCIMFVGCSDDDENDYINSLTGTTDTIRLGYGAGEFDIPIKHNVKFEINITEGAEWLSMVVTKSVTDTTDVAFTYTLNETSGVREAQIEITGADTTLIYSVIQDARKKVVRVVKQFSEIGGQDNDTTLFSYDASGQLSRITLVKRNGGADVQKISYETNKIIIEHEYRTETIELEGGRANKRVIARKSGDRSHRTYTYSDNYISSSVGIDTLIRDEKVLYFTDTMMYYVENGNLLKTEAYSYNSSSSYTSSIVDNNMNIDFVYGMMDVIDVPTLLCVRGDRFLKLPKEKRLEAHMEGVTQTYKYEEDKEGYVTKITETYGDDAFQVYYITYE